MILIMPNIVQSLQPESTWAPLHCSQMSLPGELDRYASKVPKNVNPGLINRPLVNYRIKN